MPPNLALKLQELPENAAPSTLVFLNAYSLLTTPPNFSQSDSLGYRFPDPSLGFGVSNAWRAKLYLLQWNHIKPLIEVYALSSSQSQPALSNKDWKLVLAAAIDKGGLNSDTGIARDRQVALQRLVPAGFDLNSLVVPMPVGVGSPAHLPAPTPVEILLVSWELCELNFRVDLYTLDQRLCPPPTPNLASDEAVQHLEKIQWQVSRRDSVLRCFSEPAFFPVSPLNANQGLSSETRTVREPFTRAFWELMNMWPNPKPRGWRDGIDRRDLSDEDFLRWERSSVVHYFCQTFLDTHSRPPILPRTLGRELLEQLQRG